MHNFSNDIKIIIQLSFYDKPFSCLLQQVVPCVSRPAVMRTVFKQTVMKKDVAICNIKLSQHTSKCDRIVLKNVIMKFDSDSKKNK